MCGISGFIGNFNQQNLLAQMAEKIAHRGPDGYGLFQNETGSVGLAHRRLSIIDTSNAASQPMASTDGRYTTIFNGEIYNFKALASKLESKGYIFNTHSDTAILAPLYDLYGVDMIQNLSGIFAFAIYDHKEKTVFIARDHMGIKPLYYTQTIDGVGFSSELKSLTVMPKIDKTIDHEALFSYVTYLWCPGEPTLFKGIRKLLPGHYMLMRTDIPANKIKIDPKRWYTPPMPQGSDYAEHYSADMLRELLDDVVAKQMLSDVPLGAFLSGGVDSSAIVASMRQKTQEPLETYCIAFSDKKGMEKEGFGDDFSYAEEVAKQYNVHLNRVEMPATSIEQMAEMAYILDEPQADPAPLFVRTICRQAKEQGVKVLLSGTGGDDVFSGYRRHQAIATLSKMQNIPPVVRKLAGKGLEFIAPTAATKRRISKLNQFISKPIEDAMLESFHFTPAPVLHDLLTPELQRDFQEKSPDWLESQLKTTQDQHPLNRMLHLEWHGFLPDHNLNYTDKASMAEGVEVRVPFLDPDLLDFAAQLPPNQKLNGHITKYILKKSQENRLSHDVLYRKKTGFGAPIRSWIVGDSLPFVREHLLSERFINRGLFEREAIHNLLENTINGKVDGSYTLLALLMIAFWLEKFTD